MADEKVVVSQAAPRTEFFPSLPDVRITSGPKDRHGRRTWDIGVATGENARTLVALFTRHAGRLRAFIFRVPGSGEQVKARFDTDEFPHVIDVHRKITTEPFRIQELLGE